MRIAVFVAAGLVVFTGFLHAQADDDDEDDTDYFPLVPTGNSMRFGMRFVGGPKVAFHNVGGVPAILATPDLTVPGDHTYNDGYVNLDTRADVNGHPYNNGQTSTWQVNYASQITAAAEATATTPAVDSSVSYHVYSADSLGTTIKGRTSTAAGWELQVGRSLGKIARKVNVSLIGGVTFSGINAKRSDQVQAQLTTVIDTYSLSGQDPPTAPYTAPTQGTRNLYDGNGNPVLDANGVQKTTTVDTSILLAQNPTRVIKQTTDGTPNGPPTTTQVDGHWQIKGSYFTFRAGPVFQVPVTERLKLSLGFGAAVAFVGSTFKIDEEIVQDDVTAPITYVDEKTRSVLLPAFYVDADAEYWLTERTGLYFGATYQKSKSFEQTLADHSATVDLGSTSGIQSGFTLRF
jgi:hypothetical protein